MWSSEEIPVEMLWTQALSKPVASFAPEIRVAKWEYDKAQVQGLHLVHGTESQQTYRERETPKVMPIIIS